MSTSNMKLNIQIPVGLKEKLIIVSALEGKKISVLVRESIEEKLEKINRRIFEQEMKSAYLDMAQENLQISDDFKYSDSENLS